MDGLRARDLLARTWTYQLSSVAVVALTAEELGRELRTQLDALCSILCRDPFDVAAVEQIGEHVAAVGYVGEDGLRRTVEVLGKGLSGLPELQPVDTHAERIVLAIGALATGFLTASRRAVFAQQEQLNLSLHKAVRDAKWNLKASEARFNEVVTSSASGIMIVGLNGHLVWTNGATGVILGYTTDELAGTNLFDLAHPERSRCCARRCGPSSKAGRTASGSHSGCCARTATSYVSR